MKRVFESAECECEFSECRGSSTLPKLGVPAPKPSGHLSCRSLLGVPISGNKSNMRLTEWNVFVIQALIFSARMIGLAGLRLDENSKLVKSKNFRQVVITFKNKAGRYMNTHSPVLISTAKSNNWVTIKWRQVLVNCAMRVRSGRQMQNAWTCNNSLQQLSNILTTVRRIR